MIVLGVKVDNLTMSEALVKAKDLLTDGRQHYIVTPNPEIILRAQDDQELRDILNRASLNLADGFGLLLAAKFLGQPLKKKITGVDFLYNLCVSSYVNGQRILLLGGFEGVAKKTAQKLKEQNPTLSIETEEEVVEAVKKINDFQPTIVFVALGAPQQEKWIDEHLKEMPSVRLAMAVGGAFDFIAGRVKRAPQWLRAMGLEWWWRLAMEPWRIGRVYNAVVRFPMEIIKRTFWK